MGHSSVTATEVYSNMNLKRMSQDFPTIVSRYMNQAKIRKREQKSGIHNLWAYEILSGSVNLPSA